MTDQVTGAGSATNTAEQLALRLNDQLGLAPAYLGNGHQAYAAGVVAAWPEHNRARFSVLLYTGQQLESAVAAERERCAKLCEELRDKHIDGTRLDTNPGNWCAEDGADCAFVCAWNDAAASIRRA